VALFLHLGTLLAVLIYFRKDWKEIFLLRDKKLIYFLLIATIISLVVAWPIYRWVRSFVVGNGLLLLMGFGLLITAYFHKKNKAFEISFNKLAAIAGFLQGLAVIPGLSRSGATIFGLSLSKQKPQSVLKLSYMMSAPIVLASSIYLLIKEPNLVSEGWISLVFSFLVGILTLHFLLSLAKKINFFKFALIFALLCFLGAFVGFLW